MSKFIFKTRILHREYDYEVKNNKVTINGNIYSVVNGKIDINGNIYDVLSLNYILFGNVEYLVKDNIVNIKNNEYEVNNNKVIIDGKEYEIKKIQYIRIKYDTDFEVVENEILEIKNSYSCVVECQILNNNRISNSYELEYDETNWVTVKKNYVDIDNSNNVNQQSVLICYIDDNYTSDKRYFYINVIDNNSGDVTTFTIIQSECDYNIQFDEDIGDLTVDNDKEFYKTINLKVYGGNKKISMIISPLSNDNISLNDDGLIVKKYIYKHLLNYNYNEYKIDINYIGLTNDNINHYIIYFYHEDNANTKQEIKVNINKNEQVGIENTLLKQFENFCDEQRKECITKQDFNKELLLNVEVPIINTIEIYSINEEEEKIIIPLIEKKIEGNKIYIFTTNNNDEHDSQIIVSPYALWCHTLSNYDYINETHVITIMCDTNFSGRVRKTMINIKNAEVMGSNITYFIEQDIDSNIKIMRD